MNRFDAEATIDRSPDAVWSYAADIAHHPDWMAASDARILSGDGTKVGARGRERVRLGPLSMDIEFEVAEADPGRRIVWRAVDGRFRHYEVGLDLEPVEGGASRASYHGAVELRGVWRVLGPLIALEGPSAIRRELAQLKANAESLPA